MNWSSRLFFFVLIAYAVFIFAAGDGAKWRVIFAGPVTSPNNSDTNSTAASLTNSATNLAPLLITQAPVALAGLGG